MRKNRCVVATFAILATCVVSILALKKAKHKKISKVIADAGYELAHDIHFPLKINRRNKI